MSDKVCKACGKPISVDDAIEQCDCPAASELAPAHGSAALRARMRFWLRGWLRAYHESSDIRRQAKAGIRGLAAVARSKALIP